MIRKLKRYFVLLAAAAVLLALSACGAAAAQPQPHTVTVTGNGVAYGPPDVAVAQIGVQTRGEDPAKAVRSNTDKMNAVTAALKVLGVEEKDIQTTNFSVYAQQNYDQEGKPTDITYVVDNTVTVTVRDLGKVGEALGEAVKAGANNIYGVTFSVSDVAKLEEEARGKAMTDAKNRAGQLAAAAGATLGEAMTINEYSTPPAAAQTFASFDGRGGGVEAPPVPVSSGQIQIALQVSVTYIIK